MEVVSSYPIEAKAALPRSMSFSFGCEVKAEIDSSFHCLTNGLQHHNHGAIIPAENFCQKCGNPPSQKKGDEADSGNGD